MIPFLKQVAEAVAADPALNKATLIFPNQRAPLFFKKHLLEYIKKPMWAPKLISIEYFFSSLSNLHEPDRLTLIHRLYKTYMATMQAKEPFYRFYFWGDMLLRDFDEIDKHLVDAPQLFRDLRNLKEIDQSFDFMPEEQKEFLKMFWQNVNQTPSQKTDEFIRIWKKLPQIYTTYVAALKADKLGYEGMIHRQVASSLTSIAPPDAPFIFVGFNALTNAEEKLLCYYVERGAKVYWDADAYYMEDEKQEAGLFLRQYRQHPILSKTFTNPPAYIRGEAKQINLIGTPQRIGQARLAGQKIEETPSTKTQPEQTVVILPDENMLLPLLHALPPTLAAVNVTMGYPLQQTLLYTFLDLAIALQSQRKQKGFYHRQVMALLTHAYVLALEKDKANLMCTTITTQNKIYISIDELQFQSPLGQRLFSIVATKDALVYLLDLIEMLGASFAETGDFSRQCAYHFHRHLSRLSKILHADTDFPGWDEFQELFHQILRPQKTPFTGEPLSGLQIMGMLETRNLDFENVHILSLNEGSLPALAQQNSYIPYRVRKAYQLPTYDHQGAMYAYLFYRLLQRSKHIWMYYSTEVTPLGSGEMSRYAKQLLYESGLPITHQLLHNAASTPAINPIVVHKTQEIYTLLENYCPAQSPSPTPPMLTPSALNDYIDCRLRFYFKYIARLREPQQVEEAMDARIFGNILHDTVYLLYAELTKKNNGTIEKEDLGKIDGLIAQSMDSAFSLQYPLAPGKTPIYKGQHLVVHAMIKEWVTKIVEHDKAYAPFTIVSLEEQFTLPFPAAPNPVLLGGKIDRIDYKNNTLRIVDYKTGGDELAITDIASLFTRDGKRNKAAFQTFFYAYLYYQKKNKGDAHIMPGLMNRKNLFAHDFIFGHAMGTGKEKSILQDVRPHFDTFEKHLHTMLNELYDLSIPFDQTNYTQNCTFCPYQHLCHK